MSTAFDWAAATGDIWADRWRDTDRALSGLAAELDAEIAAAAPDGPFRALDIGSGPGSTTLALASAQPDATILGCDLSPALARLASARAADLPAVSFEVGDAQAIARQHGPFDLLFSRHGVMFFEEPAAAFASLRRAAAPGARLVFSCFQRWEANPWAWELAEAAAGAPVPPPGRAPSGFAFADPHYVAEILSASGWAGAEPRAVNFDYQAGSGADAADEAFAFLTELGPAARLLGELSGAERPAALARIRNVIEGHDRNGRVVFPAAAWIWSARAG